MLEIEKYFEDFQVGDTRTTPTRTIFETDIVMHAMHSGDWMPHHTDIEFCKKQTFEKPIMHGAGTFSICMGLCVQGEPLNTCGMSYGYNKIRYPKPVFAGDTIHVDCEILSKEDHPKNPKYGIVIEAKVTKNQHDEVVCYTEHCMYVEKKPS